MIHKYTVKFDGHPHQHCPLHKALLGIIEDSGIMGTVQPSLIREVTTDGVTFTADVTESKETDHKQCKVKFSIYDVIEFLYLHATGDQYESKSNIHRTSKEHPVKGRTTRVLHYPRKDKAAQVQKGNIQNKG